MNEVRIIVSNLFKTPMGNMGYPAYFQYIGTAGKVTQRSIVDIQGILLEYIEKQEAKNTEIEATFKDIHEIISTLMKKNKELEMRVKILEFPKDIKEPPQEPVKPKKK